MGSVLDFIFPRRCVSCHAFQDYLCSHCKVLIKPVDGMICPMCERPSFDGKTHPACTTRYSLDGLVSFLQFAGPMKDIIHRLKYRPWMKDLVAVLMLSILSSIESKRGEFGSFVLVPVPLHPRRERQRGFNQAALIGKAIAHHLGLEFEATVLRRIRNTKPQVELKGEERRENIKGAFTVSTNYDPRTMNAILLIDDVWTTGSTLRSCANVLKRSGAKKVWAMTLAR